MKGFADAHLHLHGTDTVCARNFLDTVADIGVTDATLLSICALPGYEITENISALMWKSQYDRIKLRVFGSFHEVDRYAAIPYEKQTERLLALGCDGIKFINMKPDLRRRLGKGIDHPDYDRALSLMEERGTPVLLHAGDPEYFWNRSRLTPAQIERGAYYGEGGFLSFREHCDEVCRMLDKHPQLNVVLAHFFFLSERPDEAERIMETYPNVKFDLTPGWEMYLDFSKNIHYWHDFFETYADRILFGTDSNNLKKERINRELNAMVRAALTHDGSAFDIPCYGRILTLRGLGLSEKLVGKICYDNYIEFVGDATSPVDQAALKDAAKQMAEDIRCDSLHKESLKFLDDFLINFPM